MKHGWVPALVLTALALSGGCRVGYEELKQLGFGDDFGGEASGGSAATTSGGTSGSANGGTSGGSQGGSTQGGTAGTDGGEAGAPSTGGTDTSGGTAGSSTGGGGTTGGTGGGRGGTGGAGSGGGGTAGSAGSTAGGGAGGTGAGAGGGGAGGASGSGGSAGAPNPALCNTGMFGGHTYLLCREERSWDLANGGCITAGMRLARIDDAAENQWLFDNAFTEMGRSTVWIGATDRTVEGEWRWTDGALFWLGDDGGTVQNGLFTAWNNREPNNLSPGEHCAVMEIGGSTPEWYDYTCGFLGPFICESL